ncbi:hypothetical protein DmAi_18770 [Acetobacter persici]|uniref:Uncharacterized protein n=1 Tax=Acetobacter persici TaxID=1076596 RepID=A0A6V8I856_9PROT|nr:hypothetical protein DmAi_18770 [Acetobacter persici]
MEKKTRFPSPTLKASVPWNAGKKEKHVWAIRFWLGSEQRIRDKASLILLYRVTSVLWRKRICVSQLSISPFCMAVRIAWAVVDAPSRLRIRRR